MLFLRPASAAQVNQFSAISALFMLVKSYHSGESAGRLSRAGCIGQSHHVLLNDCIFQPIAATAPERCVVDFCTVYAWDL